MSPAVIEIPVPPVKCDRTLSTLGPVYVNTPDAESYAKLPSPPASTAVK